MQCVVHNFLIHTDVHFSADMTHAYVLRDSDAFQSANIELARPIHKATWSLLCGHASCVLGCRICCERQR